jgi:hypothetical protein
MGFTIYWNKNTEITPTQEQVKRTVTRVIREVFRGNTRICHEFDEPETPPCADGRWIRFNGKGGDGHETFYLAFGDDEAFSFCKTARKPYTRDVVDVLRIVTKEIPGWLLVRSDDGDIPFDDPEGVETWLKNCLDW